ncbi:MAG: lipopolysaccharide heptosyltransferase I [Acidobacteria bacterium]|nr:lipopolysaccharide heptosyltransferase I [Acidobacteriota bacterium]
MHILIVKLGAIGDIIHALPAAAAVRRHLPDAEISWVAETRSAEILRESPVLNNLIEIDTRSLRGGKVVEEMFLDMGRQFKEVRQFRYDIAMDMQGLLKSAVIARVSGAGQRWGFGKAALREPASRFLLTDTVDIPPRTHVVAKNMLLASKALGFDVPEAKYEFPIAANDEHRAEANAIAEQAKGRFALLNPAGGWVTKLWHAEKYGELADRLWEELGIVSVVATGPAESELAERVMRASRSEKIISSQPSLKGFYELAKMATVYVGGDTGPTHLAIAAGAPVVGIFGPTEWWRNGSTNPDDICVERNDIDCRVDCHRRTCDKWICMDIDVDTVFRAVKERLAQS